MTRLILIYSFIFLNSFTFFNYNKDTPNLPKEYVYIPDGSFLDGDSDTSKRVSLQGFYMSKYEITNLQYREFLLDMSTKLSVTELEKIKVDSSGWQEIISYGEPLFQNYFNHPAYNNYPVVNLQYLGALKYCSWLQQKMQTLNPDFTINIKLPSMLQWTYAARGGRGFVAKYPWSGNYLRDKYGKFLCNFNFIDESAIVRNKDTGEPQIINQIANHSHLFATQRVGTYLPNSFGLFNMSGNVAEMVDTIGISMGGSWNSFGGEVKTTSFATYNKPSSTVGFRPIIIFEKITK